MARTEMWRSGLKRVFRAVLVGIVAGYFVSGIVTGKASVLGYRVFFVMSGSMEPTVRTHRFVIGRVADGRDVETGDIVAYRKGDGLVKKMVIHRVVGFGADGKIVLQGDNNAIPDPPIEADRVLYEIIFY